MKRKLFSAILFGACLVASTSGLTSCKDYDDDISNLQSQIDKLATKEELATKASELSTAISNAQSAADAAKKTAEDAAAAAKTATTGAEAAQKAADAAQAAADKAQKAADAAQAAADKNAEDLKKAAEGATKAVEEIQTAMKGLATTEAVTAAVKEVADKYDAQAKDLKALSDRLDKVEAKLGLGEGGEDIDLTEIQAELEDIEDAFEALVGVVSNMVTSVELVPNATITGNNALEFTIVTEQKNDTFGKDVADKILTTAKGHTCFEGSEVVVRVNPADAEITEDDIALINSKGEEISDLVKAVKVERYSNDKYLIRSTGNNTGLWKIKYAPVEGKTAAELAKKFSTDSYSTGATSTSNLILYAVSVKSAISDSIEADRRVVSDYDVTMQMSPAKSYVANINDSQYSSLNKTDITVNGKSINTLINRSTAGEPIWDTTGPQVTPITSGTGQNTVNTGDNRGTGSYLIARVGEDMTIKFTQKIKGFYVRLDYDFVETASAPSELNAWNSYKYVNVGTQSAAATMFEGQEGTIKVSALSGEATGDVIGFRIYAMNLDGTLVDPDGLAFYVNLGDNGTDVSLGAKSITVTQPTAGNWTDGYSFTKGTLANTKAVNWTVKYGTTTIAATDAVSGAANYEIQYHVNGGTTWEAYTAANAAKYDAVKFNIKNPVAFKDNSTFDLIGEVQKQTSPSNTNYTAFTMTGTLTKNLPTSAPAYVFNVGQTEEQILKAVGGYDYAITDANSLAGAKDGVFDYNDAFIQSKSGNPYISQDGQFQFYLAKSARESAGKPYDKPLETVATGSSAPYTYKATIPYGLIDNATPHAVSTTYNYGAISSETFQNRGVGHERDWIVNTTSGYSIKYMTWSYQATGYMQYAWLTKAFKDGSTNVTKTFDEVLNGKNFTIDLSRVVANPGNKISQELRRADLKSYVYNTTDGNWLKVIDVQTEADGIQNPYYKFNNATSGVVNMDRKAGVNNVPEHTATLKIKVQDCFGHVEIISLTVKFVNDKPTYTWNATSGKVEKLQADGSYSATGLTQ